jgi:PASTA domain
VWPAAGFFLYLVVHGVSDEFLYYRSGFTLVAIAVAVIVLAAVETRSPVVSFLSVRPLRAVGRVSYGLYIWHLAVFIGVLYFLGQWPQPARFAAGIAITALVCVASWHLVEQPFLRWKERLDSDPREIDAPTPVTGSPSVAVKRSRQSRALLVAAGVVCVATVVGLGALAAETPKSPPPKSWPVTAEMVAVPTATGNNIYAAAHALSEEHLNVKIVKRTSSTTPTGTVLTQDPRAGTRVHRGTVVTIVVSIGPAPNP